jgi:hypothetical protein
MLHRLASDYPALVCITMRVELQWQSNRRYKLTRFKEAPCGVDFLSLEVERSLFAHMRMSSH